VAAAIQASVAAAEGGAGASDEPPAPRIVHSRRYRVKPMSAEDAVLELEATAGDLLVFRESQTYRINVVYRQRDGNYALIDPDL
jgi:putative sigma-54 modulation protein